MRAASKRWGLIAATLVMVAATIGVSAVAGSSEHLEAFDDALVLGPSETSGSVDVLDNDHVPDGVDAEILSFTDADFGDVLCEGSGCTYELNDDLLQYFEGTDEFTYTIWDGGNPDLTSTATVHVTVEPPVAVGDVLEIDPLTGYGEVDVLVNDDGRDLWITDWTGGLLGTVGCEAEGPICSYQAGESFDGEDEFTYFVVDLYGRGTEADVIVRWAEPEPDPDPIVCPEVAEALDGGGIIVGEEWIECSSATANGVVGQLTPLFPPVGGTSVLMTTGDVSVAPGPNDESEAGVDNGTSARGANDVSILRVDLLVPEGANCLSFDFLFGSEEYPEYVGSPFNDAFLAELGQSAWVVEGSEISAPGNFAVDPQGRVISINSGFFSTQLVVTDSGLQYNGTTPKLIARTPITPGEHALFLSIFDAGDWIQAAGDDLQLEAQPRRSTAPGRRRSSG
jgi:hypothetical protein